jgi:hypothetical protein
MRIGEYRGVLEGFGNKVFNFTIVISIELLTFWDERLSYLL